MGKPFEGPPGTQLKLAFRTVADVVSKDANSTSSTIISTTNTTQLDLQHEQRRALPGIPASPIQSSDGASSILSSASAYARKKFDVKVQVKLRIATFLGAPCVVVQTALSRQMRTISTLKRKRGKFSLKEKKAILAAYEEFGACEAVRRANAVQGFEHIRRQQIYRWRKDLQAVKKRPGRPPTNAHFNAAVLSQLVFAKVQNSTSDVIVEANVAYSYPIIREAAKDVRQQAEFRDDEDLKKLTFSNNWISTWLKNVRMRRRRMLQQVPEEAHQDPSWPLSSNVSAAVRTQRAER